MADDEAVQAPGAAEFGDLLDRIANDLNAVEGSMRRLDDGTYGSCDVCGRQIGEDDLERRPLATTCADHGAQ